MALSEESYGEPVKQRARQRLIHGAVAALCSGRSTSPLVSRTGFDRMLDYCVEQMSPYTTSDLREAAAELRNWWHGVHSARIGKRKPGELKVLFLSGPKPLNDVLEFARLGVCPTNMWAVESDRDTYRKAIEQLKQHDVELKLHFGSLHEFFILVPEQFDIVYFDACGPLFGATRTEFVLRELFLNQRLAPLAALITNFACKLEDQAEVWKTRLHAWYAPRFEQPAYCEQDDISRVNERETFQEHIGKHLTVYYSDFITRFTIEFSSLLVPWWRFWALKASKEMYFAKHQMRELAAKAALNLGTGDTWEEMLGTIGHALLSPSSYPFMVMADQVRQNLPVSDRLRELLFMTPFQAKKLGDAISIISLMRRHFSGQAPIAKHNLGVFGDQLKQLLDDFMWFDSEGAELHRLFCDTPLSNLVTDLLIGVYGYPYHANVQKQQRIEYIARKTPMFCDLFVMDQCRYMYDLVPALPLFGRRLPLSLQLALRVCIDGIRRHGHCIGLDIFVGSFLAGAFEDGFRSYSWPKRVKMD
jgi:hypothetical protein